MSIPILGEIERLINEHGSSTILKEHLALLNTKLALLKEHIEKLEKENASVIKENTDLKQQLTRQDERANFVEARGALFKRIPGGGYIETPHCPYCHRAMTCLRRALPFECSNKSCNHVANFKGIELWSVLAKLPK